MTGDNYICPGCGNRDGKMADGRNCYYCGQPVRPSHRQRLVAASGAIAAKFDKPVAPSWYALSKLVVQPRWIAKGQRAPGLRRWKRGEVFEILTARNREDFWEEVGDCGYYIAQSWTWLWWLYERLAPESVIAAACEKFEQRANRRLIKTIG